MDGTISPCVLPQSELTGITSKLYAVIIDDTVLLGEQELADGIAKPGMLLSATFTLAICKLFKLHLHLILAENRR